MRLINTKTYQLEEFYDGCEIPNARKAQLYGSGNVTGIPDYAILSHTWGAGEVSFQEMKGDRSLVEQKPGFRKIRNSCRRARRDGHLYIWVDTCCIDKTSSTELTEAINSMYQWYKNSAICYAFLADVKHDANVDNTNFEDSRWFTRGWTLQELIAPPNLHFFDRDWMHMGTRHDHMLQISRLSHIDVYALDGGDLQLLSIARRMSWAARRQTTRLEDRAYCLLGIFNISMPLLYGEGSKPFVRLQEEIMKISDDQSLFAWADLEGNSYRDDYPEASNPQGLLASSPDVFSNSRNTAQFHGSGTPGREISVVTNKGLQIELLMCKDSSFPSGQVYLAILDCQIGHSPGLLAGIRLRRLSPNGEEYARVDMAQLFTFGILDVQREVSLQGFNVTKPQKTLYEVKSSSIYSGWENKVVFIPQYPSLPLMPAFWLIPPTTSKFDEERMVAYPVGLWDIHTLQMQPQPSLGHGRKKIGAIYLQSGIQNCIIIFGVTGWELKPWCSTVKCEPVLHHRNGSAGTLAKFWKWDDVRFQELKTIFNNFLSDWPMRPADEDTDVKSEVESVAILGRDMYILRVSFNSPAPARDKE